MSDWENAMADVKTGVDTPSTAAGTTEGRKNTERWGEEGRLRACTCYR